MRNHSCRAALAAAFLLGCGAAHAQAQAPSPYAAPPAAAAYARPAPVMPPLRPGQAERLLRELEAAPSHGFAPDAFRTDEIGAVLASGDRARADENLIAATLRYARAMRGGRIDPRSVSSDWAVAPAPFDAASELTAALQQDRLDAWLASLPPPYHGYNALRTALGRYRQIAASGGWGRLPEGVTVQPGSSDPRMIALRARLTAEGYSVGSGAGAVYDPALVDAVKRFQRRRGMNPDGVLGPGTVRALNVSAAARAAQIEANLERWRWIPREMPVHRIEVNLPTAMLDYYREGRAHETMLVAVGDRKHHTPMMTSDIVAITFNPPWNVPTSIVVNEILPKLKTNPGYLASQGLKVVGRSESGIPYLQQAPGPRSALGKVKFESPNEFAVFLHDTPSRGGFSRADRLLSHGCVRLQKPLELATLLLEDHPEWSEERMQQAMDSGKTSRIGLEAPVPMYLLYWTAFVDTQGGVYFWDDIYGWDSRLLAALEQSPTLASADGVGGGPS